MSCCNLKVGVITIAVLTIVFSSLHLARVVFEGVDGHRDYHQKHHESHKHHHYHKGKPYRSDGRDFLKEMNEEYKDKKNEEKDEVIREEDMMVYKKKDDHEEFKIHMRVGKTGIIVSIVSDVISIVTACLIFAVVSDDVGKNQRRRHFMLPFIVWHLLGIILLVVASIYAAIVFRENMSYLTIPLLITGAVIIILVLFVGVVIRYFNSLRESSGFTYAQMDDFKDEVKKPLA